MIDRNRWQQLSALLDEALALLPADRPTWLRALRLRDAELADQLEPMLGTDLGDGEATALQPHLSVFERHLAPALNASTPGAPKANAPQPGQRMGPWELMYQIGAGGMGEVWLARRADGLFEAQAAIKLLRSDLPAASLTARFARERAVLARLNHPSVARLLDAGIADDGQAYLVLEFVAGRSLGTHVHSECPTVAQRVRLLIRVAEGVDYAHAQLIVHRDLKPSNVMVTAHGAPKLLDFGIAGLLDDTGPVDTDLTRQTGRGLTLGYAAPEQILGQPIGTAADVFSLGVMLFELLTGDLPFAPRNSARPVIEQAVLHDEPKRIAAVLSESHDNAATEPGSPGRPVDAQRARGDLDAVVAKALRKDPAQRYGSVRELVDDLQRWLDHQPVSVRRDDWRHRSGLWLRRHTVLAASTVVVISALSAGLGVATVQWQRAQAAARQSDQVTTYLTELLASANPAEHAGQWPNVLQLLDRSRQTLPQQFRDDPQTKIRILDVLAETYHELNRFDVSFPLFDELVAMSEREFGSDDKRTIAAKLNRAKTWQVQGSFDKSVAALEPLRLPTRQVFGAQSDEYQRLLHVLSTSYTRTGRLDEAERMLAEAGTIIQARYQPGEPEWLSHQNHIQVLRTTQGRFREALAVMLGTQPHWASIPSEYSELRLTLQRNTIAVQLRLSEYDHIEERVAAVLADGDRLRGPGNEFSAGMRAELARYYSNTGQYAQAAAQRDENLQRALNAKVDLPATLIGLRSAALLARAQGHTAPQATLLADARQLLSEMDREGASLGFGRADAWLDLARLALLFDEQALASEVLRRLRADVGLLLDRNVTLASRVAQAEGELARLRGDLPRSIELLRRRVASFPAAGERRVHQTWAASLDLAYSLVLSGDPAAGEAIQQAMLLRPPGMPAGHPLDLAGAYLALRQQHGRDDADAVRAALTALLQAQLRPPGSPPRPGLGSLGGAFI
jgi:serine/threonine-protein kinase